MLLFDYPDFLETFEMPFSGCSQARSNEVERSAIIFIIVSATICTKKSVSIYKQYFESWK